jgi:hypothetical protein
VEEELKPVSGFKLQAFAYGFGIVAWPSLLSVASIRENLSLYILILEKTSLFTF